MARSLRLALLVAVSMLAVAGVDASARAEDDPTTIRARNEFVLGAEFVKRAQWGEALAAFERSRTLHPHALTTYNIGACERALGHYTRARRALLDALAQDERAEHTQLAEGFTGEAKTFLREIEGLLVHVDLTLSPAEAALSFDGRPLIADVESKTTWVSGLAPTGPATVVGGRLAILTDPGAHVLVLSRKGYGDVVVNKTFLPASKPAVAIELEKLPGVLRIRAERDGAVVTVDELDVGIAPVEISRPAGAHTVVVRKSGFVTYRSQVDVRAGEQLDLRAPLEPEVIPITKKWWFWTLTGAAVTGAAVGTYFLARPGPTRPPVDGGGLGWAATVQ